MGPHESLHFVEDLIDMRDAGGDCGKPDEGTLAEILVVQLSRGDSVATSGRVEKVAHHLAFVLQAGRGWQAGLDVEQCAGHWSMIPAR